MIITKNHGDGWITMMNNKKTFMAQIRAFEDTSEYGINEGRISKLVIVKKKSPQVWNNPIVSYDRGWDIKPKSNSQAEKFYKEIIKRFN